MQLSSSRVRDDARLENIRLSRRHFVAAAGLAVASPLIAACGGDSSTPSDGGSNATTPAGSGSTDATTTAPAGSPSAGGEGEPRRGGILNLTISSWPPNFDVHQNSTFVVYTPMAPCYSLLVQYDVNEPTSLGPDLAENWEVSSDGLSLTFHLREGVKFHHGKTLTSEDAKASFDRIRNPPEGMTSPRQAVFDAVESIDTPDDLTVVFNLTSPSASLLPNLGQGWMSIFPKDVLDEKGDMKFDIVGTGPFRLKELTEGVKIVLERNPDYFMPDRPYLDEIHFYVIEDDNTAASNFISGQLHQIGLNSYDEAVKIQQQLGEDKVRLHKVISTSLQVLEMNAEREPWNDPRVRKAASLAIDRVQANEILEGGHSVLTGIMHPEGAWTLPPEEIEKIPGYTTDPQKKAEEIEQAKQLLAEAGYPNGIEAVMLVRQGAQYEATAIFLQDQLKKVGINCVLDVNETATFYEKQDARDFDLFGGSYSIAIDDPDAAYFGSWVCGAGRNYSNYCDPQFDELVQQQAQEMDVEKRRELVHQIERYALENALKAVLCFRVTWILQSASVQNYKRNYSQYITETHRDTWLSA